METSQRTTEKPTFEEWASDSNNVKRVHAIVRRVYREGGYRMWKDAEDYAQELLLHLARKGWADWDPQRGPLDNYLSALASRNLSQHARYLRHRRSQNGVDSLPIFTTDSFLDESLIWEETRGRLQETVQTLPPKQREVATLFLKGVSVATIAETLQCTDQTVRNRLRKCVFALHAILVQDESTPAPQVLFPGGKMDNKSMNTEE